MILNLWKNCYIRRPACTFKKCWLNTKWSSCWEYDIRKNLEWLEVIGEQRYFSSFINHERLYQSAVDLNHMYPITVTVFAFDHRSSSATLNSLPLNVHICKLFTINFWHLTSFCDLLTNLSSYFKKTFLCKCYLLTSLGSVQKYGTVWMDINVSMNY